jgi:hypothetical protein
MIEALTAMSLDQRLTELSFAEVLVHKSKKMREQKKENEIASKELFDQGLPHAMAMMAINAQETKKVNKEVAFLNDMLHPDSVYEPASFTAMKAAKKYFTN